MEYWGFAVLQNAIPLLTLLVSNPSIDMSDPVEREEAVMLAHSIETTLSITGN
jgi:hypothetical protein